ncbi:MAG: ATP-binding protein [Elusimicrobiota bacterium]|jgi:signal transduction histidine kinase
MAQPPEIVLIADDEEEDLRFLSDLVRSDGFTVYEAHSGSQAEVLLQEHKFDLVITDLVMPGMSGFEVMRLAHKTNPDAICIAMTGFGSLESAVDALRHGAYSYLLKPCDPGTVRNCLERGLEKQRLTKELRQRNLELEKLNRDLDSKVQEATAELCTLNHRMLTEMASLREVDQLKTAFLNNVSHDLKSPLTTIIGYAEFLLENAAPGLGAENRTCLATLRKAAAHMQYLINQLVDAARLTSGKIALDMQALSLAEVMEEAAALVRSQMAAKDIRFELRRDPGEPLRLRADRGRMMQILSNLLGNACKFTPNGGRIELSAKLEDGQAHFCVSDSGIGIAPEHHGRIFERFYQVDRSPSKAFKGLGLGLRIAKDLVELHGGRIWVESQPGQGSQFHFSIPA